MEVHDDISLGAINFNQLDYKLDYCNRQAENFFGTNELEMKQDMVYNRCLKEIKNPENEMQIAT
jgi:hypothetical protein